MFKNKIFIKLKLNLIERLVYLLIEPDNILILNFKVIKNTVIIFIWNICQIMLIRNMNNNIITFLQLLDVLKEILIKL